MVPRILRYGGKHAGVGIYLMIAKFLDQRSFFTRLEEQFQELGMFFDLLLYSFLFAENYEKGFKPLYLLTKDMQAELAHCYAKSQEDWAKSFCWSLGDQYEQAATYLI